MAEPPQGDPEDKSQAAEALAVHSADVVENPEDLEEVAPLSEAPGPRFSQEEHLAKATKLLALLLFGALISSFVAHLVCILCLAHDKPNSVEEVSRVFNTWTPIFSGLFGSAATFYFTQGHK
ncbi:MAG: hypothetical protein ABSC76_10490 [Terracidiphilus sp.]|jgi:hypothetical protein